MEQFFLRLKSNGFLSMSEVLQNLVLSALDITSCYSCVDLCCVLSWRCLSLFTSHVFSSQLRNELQCMVRQHPTVEKHMVGTQPPNYAS